MNTTLYTARRRFARATLVASVTLLAIAAPSLAQTRVDVVPVPQNDAPIRIVSVTHTTGDLLSQVVVQNFTDRSVESYQLGWVVLIPSGCAGKPTEPLVKVAPTEQITIAPETTSQTGSYRLWVKDMLALGRDRGASLVHVQAGVVAVHFADGSKWSFNLAQQKVFDKDLLEFESNSCAGSSATSACSPAPGVSESATSFLGGPSPLIFFFCNGVPINIYCRNEVSSCTNVVCKSPSDCPRQECQVASAVR